MKWPKGPFSCQRCVLRRHLLQRPDRSAREHMMMARRIRFGRRLRLTGIATASAVSVSTVVADTVVLNSVKDNTLIEPVIGGDFSNGMGDSIYAGRVGFQGSNAILRGVLAFDLTSVPAGSTIQSASLSLFQVSTVAGPEVVELHKMLASW